MSEKGRLEHHPSYNLHPLMGLDRGKRWGRKVGELSQRLTHLDSGVARLELKAESLESQTASWRWRWPPGRAGDGPGRCGCPDWKTGLTKN